MEANYTFYQGLELECCKVRYFDQILLGFNIFCSKDLEHVNFPEHSPVKSGGLKDIRLDAKEEKSSKAEIKMDNHDEKKYSEDGERSDTPAQDDTSIILEVLEHLHIEPTGTGKSPSKVAMLLASRGQQEALPHMKTLSSVTGLRPEFSSWSLVCMGSSHLYSHSAGLGQQPGFISSAKFLLPWEVRSL